ncbi:YdcF family protein [Methylobacterium gnaphalii]|uniref:DUF218 domain-containing protein n=1 Tax=Methylobacterium gnaphalii TaxID=1010610 RepID=A0A512JI62_9HYPH|nr:YdcF family protein [Methylobacterium gnaphalii]GEP09572.1 hypothetical protein MGN01_14170 [Methylobacterium gnaphalii]GJD67841.1 hypothetical protein MMMDOFMJ_0758 [Methylobacterium gnaphalii]GLS48130.1 hypothetical protein GCM10007885_09740 [Methylobacterium gnaphalii]
MTLRTLTRTRDLGIGTPLAALEALGWAWQSAGVQDCQFRAGDGRRAASSAPRPLLRLVRLALAGTVALGALALFAGFLLFVSTIERMERRPSGRADGIVALTGGAQRVGDAIELLAGGYGRRLLISGVNERTSREEIARLNPSQGRLIECCVDLDYRARNTIGNAIETRRWMRRHHFETIAVVTSNYHMPRTLVEIGHALAEGQSAVPYPVIADGFEIGRWWQDPAVARLVGAEYVKFLAAWLRTRVEGDPEQSRFAVLVGRGKPSKAPVRMVAEPQLPMAN